MNSAPRYYERTKHKKIYANTYWGAFRCELEQKYIDNRNDFVTEYNINSYYKMPSYMLRRFENIFAGDGQLYDHKETYKTRDGKCVIVISPYYVTEEGDKKLTEMGFVKYKPLYGDGTTTYVLVTYIGRK
jgi:hypothetical protein